MFETEIARGIALLDQQRPGWETQIDLDRLNLANMYYQPESDDPEYNCGCVLAQTGRAFGFGMQNDFGSYLTEARALEGALTNTQDFGFSVVGETTHDDNYSILTAEWKAAILALRAERAVEAVQEAVPC